MQWCACACTRARTYTYTHTLKWCLFFLTLKCYGSTLSLSLYCHVSVPLSGILFVSVTLPWAHFLFSIFTCIPGLQSITCEQLVKMGPKLKIIFTIILEHCPPFTLIWDFHPRYKTNGGCNSEHFIISQHYYFRMCSTKKIISCTWEFPWNCYKNNYIQCQYLRSFLISVW